MFGKGAVLQLAGETCTKHCSIIICHRNLGGLEMNRPSRSMRKLLDSVATNNEAAALDVMRAAEQLQDEVLRQCLLNLIHRLNQDANDLRMARDDIQGGSIRLA
jgi:hypothetical protein